MQKNNKARVKYYVERSSSLVNAAVIFMALSAVFRIVGCWGLWSDQAFAATQIALPLACNLLFIVCLLLLGSRAFCITAVPVILGVVFFIIKSLTFSSWVHTLLCILLYMLVAGLYTATAFGFIRTKWLLVPLFGLPFIYHIAVEDAAALRDTAHTVTFSAGMQEISVLCIMLSLLLTALAMKKRPALEDVELPKIKDPKVIVPKPQAAETVQVEAAVPEKAEESAAECAGADAPCVQPEETAQCAPADAPQTAAAGGEACAEYEKDNQQANSGV